MTGYAPELNEARGRGLSELCHCMMGCHTLNLAPRRPVCGSEWIAGGHAAQPTPVVDRQAMRAKNHIASVIACERCNGLTPTMHLIYPIGPRPEGQAT
jgi:hypothetical protein